MCTACEGIECCITQSGVICVMSVWRCLFCCVRPADGALLYDADFGPLYKDSLNPLQLAIMLCVNLAVKLVSILRG